MQCRSGGLKDPERPPRFHKGREREGQAAGTRRRPGTSPRPPDQVEAWRAAPGAPGSLTGREREGPGHQVTAVPWIRPDQVDQVKAWRGSTRRPRAAEVLPYCLIASRAIMAYSARAAKVRADSYRKCDRYCLIALLLIHAGPGGGLDGQHQARQGKGNHARPPKLQNRP